MADQYLIKKTTLDDLAAKVRILRDISELLTPNRMAEEIEAAAAELAETKEELEAASEELREANNNLKAAIEGVGDIDTEIPTSIADGKFEGNKSIMNVSMPSVYTIGVDAFKNCTGLTSAHFLNTVDVGNNAFGGCTGLANISLPKSYNVGISTFQNCTSLTNVDFPEATYIEEYAFDGCTALASVSIPKATKVGNYAFQDCTSLTNADFPEARTVGNYAFDGCTALTEADLPKVTSIGIAAFLDCTSLAIAEFIQATSIGDNAFDGCTGLIRADFPGATSVGSYAFDGCTELGHVNIPRMTSIGSYAFRYCENLTNADFPEATSIGNYAFDGCIGLTSVNIPRVTSLGIYSFRGCNRIKEIDLDAVSEPISIYTFDGCSSLYTLILREPSIVDLTVSSAFTNTPIANGVGYIYVPSALVADYQAHAYWGAYGIRAIEDYPEIMGYKWEKYTPPKTYQLTWDGGTATSSGTSSATVTTYSSYSFDTSTGELTPAGSSTSKSYGSLSGTIYRVSGGVVQKYLRKTSSSSSGTLRYTVTWTKPKITEVNGTGAPNIFAGYVTSRDPNRYPDNGVAVDGCKYVKVTGTTA